MQIKIAEKANHRIWTTNPMLVITDMHFERNSTNFYCSGGRPKCTKGADLTLNTPSYSKSILSNQINGLNLSEQPLQEFC